MTVPAGVERPLPSPGGPSGRGPDPLVHIVCTDCYPQARLGLGDGTFRALCGHTIPLGDPQKGNRPDMAECVVCLDLTATHRHK